MKYIKKILIIFIVCVLNLTNVSAQKGNSFAGFRVGYALPMGQFASHDFATGGYALLGKSIGGEAAWFVSPKLGFGFDVSSKTFGFAAVSYRDDYIENEPSYLKMDLLSGPYKIQTYMGGAYYKVNITNKFYSTFKLMGGMYTARTPDQFYGVDNFGGIKTTFWKTGTLDRTFGFLTGASFEYKIFDHVSILLQADFSYAQPAFVYIKNKDTYTKNINMPIFQLLPGVNIQF